jgi:hypothetical protein
VIETIEHNPSVLIGRLITKRAPIHTYNYSKAIRRAKPYISFIFVDTDTLPSVTNIPFDRPDIYDLSVDDTQQVDIDLYLRYPEDLRQSSDDNRPGIQVVMLDCKASAVEKSISYKASDTSLRLSPSFTFLSIIEQLASLDAVLDLDKKHKAISTIPYLFENKPVQYTNTTTRQQVQYDSYNHSLAMIEPRCFDYQVSKTSPGNKIVRYHRYLRADHIVSNQGKEYIISRNRRYPNHAIHEDK